ncbi:MAG: Ig-like domain-containing protein [candidate division KSB1 bacterium]|nr:Ig-like domain-containing protein [candidate division KSB1 bacterium]
MKVKSGWNKILLIVLTAATVYPLHAAIDEFNRPDGPLGSNWAAHSDMVIRSGRLHNNSSSTTAGWNSFIAVFNVINANEATIYWPTAGNGISSRGAEFGAVVFVNNFSAASNGYMIYIYNNEMRLYQISNGAVGSAVVAKTVNRSPVPGDRFKVLFNPNTYEFTSYINGTAIATLQDASKRVNLSTSYAGVMLYHSTTIENDVEAFEANVVPIAADTTPPAAVTNLAATAVSSSSVQLTWTATGDDGNTGTATLYDIRYSKNNITAADFNSATQVTGVPSPKQAGAAESFTVTGLSADTKYYFALKVRDDAGNWSNISNVASATTPAAGGGGGGTMPTLNWRVDDFERSDLGSNWAAPNYKIEAGELTLINKTGGWNNFAIYQRAGAYGVGMTFSATNAALYNNAFVPAGLLFMLDNASPAGVNGYLLRRAANSIDIFRITGGVVATTAVKSASTTLAAPKPGEKIEAVIINNGATKTIRVFVRGQLDGALDLSDASNVDNTYVGVALYGGTGFLNNLASFTAGYPGTSATMRVEVYGGNNQSGPISQQLPQPIQVIVKDENNQPLAGRLLDFQIIQGTARLDDIENFVFPGQVWKEAEEGRILRANGRIASDAGASKGQYVTYDWITGLTRLEMFAVPFYLPQNGRFDVWVRGRTTDATRFRYHVRIDSSPDSTLVSMQTNNIGQWHWVRAMSNVALNAGMHDLKLIPFHADLQWDKILVQNAGSAAPTGVGGEGPVYPNMTNENGIGSTRVTFGTNANDNVIIYVYVYRDDGSKVEEPAVFTLDPTPGPATAMQRDPSVPEPVNGVPGMTSPELKVIIKDAYGNFVNGVTVNWRVLQGEGTLASPTSVSNNAGVASNTLQLNYYQSTDYKVEASATGLNGSPIVFTIKPGTPPNKIVRIQPKTRQQGNVATRIDSLLIVQILKADNTPFEGYPVKFVVTEGGGRLSTQGGNENAQQLDVPTDQQGFARAVWQLGGPNLNVVQAQAPNLIGNPIIFEAWAMTGAAANLVKADGDNQAGYLGLPLLKPFVVKVTDANGYAVSEQEIVFEIQQGQGAYFDQPGIRSKTVYSDNQGLVRVTLTMGSVLNEEHIVRATATGTSLSPVFFRATATARIAKTIEYVSGNPPGYQRAVVNSQLAEDFIVRVRDPFGNPVAEQLVLFKVMSGGGKFTNGLTEMMVASDAQGLARTRLTVGPVAGDSSNVVHATSQRKDITTQALDGSPIIFKANGLPRPAVKIVKIDSTDAQSAIVGYPLKYPIAVRVTDEYLNPVRNHSVTFRVRGQGGELEDIAGRAAVKVVATDARGIASVIWNMPGKPGVVYVDVSSNSLQGTPLEGSPLVFIAEAMPGQPNRMVRVTKDTVFVGKVWQPLQEKMKVQITDYLGNPLIGQPVIFKVTRGGGVVNGLPQVTILTADSGYASVTWTLGKTSGVELNWMEASASVPVNPVIRFRATTLPDIAFQLIPDSSYSTFGVVGSLIPEEIKVKVADQFGNGIPGHTVNFDIIPVNNNSGYIGQPGVTQAAVVTNAEGIAAVRWGLGPQVGSMNNKLRAAARLNNVHLINSPYVFTASATVGGPTKMVKAVADTNLTSIIGNTLPEFLRVKVTDAYDNPIAQVPVRFQVISRREADGGTLDGLVDSVKIKLTDSNGMAWVQFTLGQRAGFKINKVRASAENNGVPLQGSPILFEITGTATNARKMRASDGDGQTGSVGQYLARELKVLALDQYDNPVKNQPIRFRILADPSRPVETIGSLGVGAAVDTSVNTDNLGIAAVRWRLGQFVGQQQVEATSNGGGALEGSPIIFRATALADQTSADSSLIAVTPRELLVSNGEIRATVTVTLRDRFKNPVVGKAVILEADGEGNIITQPTTATDANGRTIGFISSRQAGVKTVRARDINSNVLLKVTAQVTFRPAAAARIVKAPGENGDTQTRNVGTVLEKPFKVLITDQFGNPIRNVPVTFTPRTGGGMMVDNQPVYSDENGIASAFYRLGLNPGANLVQAVSEGLDGSPVNFSTIAVQPQQIKELVILSGNRLSGRPAGDLPEPLSVRVIDNLGWPIFGKKVKFEVLANDGVITSENPAESNMYGVASVNFKLGTTLGLNIIRASLVDLPIVSAVFTDTTKVMPGSGASMLQLVSGNNQYGTVNTMLPMPLTVKVTDDYNNPVPGITVTMTVIDDHTVQGIGRLEGGAKVLARTTDAFGLVSVYYTLGEKAGLNKIRVTSAGLRPEFIDFTVYGQAGAPYSMRKLGGDNQTGEMDRVLLRPISVRVYDREGNPAQGGRVRFIVLQGGGTIIEPQPVISDADGIAQVHWRLGPRPNAYVNVAQAIADGLPGGMFVETFNAIGDPSRWPQLHLPSDRTVYENDILSFTIYADGSDNPPITCTAESIPEGSALSSNGDGTWTFTWQPSFSFVQAPQKTRTIYAVFGALDMKGGRDLDSVKITVIDRNRAPQIVRYWPTQEVIKVEPGTLAKIDFGVEVRDEDGDLVTVTWYVDEQQKAYGQTFTMDLNQYPPYRYYSVNVRATDHSDVVYRWWGVKVKVQLVNLSCTAEPYKGVHLTWETVEGALLAGFNVLRGAREDGEYTKINDELIPYAPDGRYQFTDKAATGGRSYYYKIEEIGLDGASSLHGPVRAEAPLPREFRLAQNYPNPFNPETTIRFDVPKEAYVTLEVYNVLGQRVRTLFKEKMEAGYHSVVWDGKDDQGLRVSSGVYYYRLHAQEFSDTKKMLLLK